MGESEDAMPRTTLNIEVSVHEELAVYAATRGESMGDAATSLLAAALRHAEREPEPPPFEWIARDMGEPLIDISDPRALKEFLFAEDAAAYGFGALRPEA